MIVLRIDVVRKANAVQIHCTHTNYSRKSCCQNSSFTPAQEYSSIGNLNSLTVTFAHLHQRLATLVTSLRQNQITRESKFLTISLPTATFTFLLRLQLPFVRIKVGTRHGIYKLSRGKVVFDFDDIFI